ncbi:MAG: DNA repair protein [Clostridia bacterium]|nr:DNA repair protein [Clostridia bacterium]
MTDKELRKLRRVELLEILLEQQHEIDRLKEQVASLEQQLKNRRIAIENAGSIAEAALAVSNIFAEAQKAADFYLDNVSRNAQTEKLPEQKPRQKD